MMQPLTATPRENLTEEQVRWLIQDAPTISTAFGLELVDQNLEVIEDISRDFGGGQVARGSYNTLHGTASLVIARDLEWGASIVRPYMIIADRPAEYVPALGQGVTARFNLGAYYTSRPERSTGLNPPAYAVTGYDILHRLADKTGAAYAVEAGTVVLDAVEQILLDRGYTRYVLDPSAAGKTLPSAYVSPLDDEKTWLGIVNDLLERIGYAGVWSDWDGQLRCAPYSTPSTRPIEWVYDLDPLTSILSPERTYTQDLFEAPNRWVFIRNNDVDGPTPVEGAGIYTYENQSTGPTSIDARDGRTITKTERIDAADQASLESRAWVTIDADMRVPQTVKAKTGPNPLHWHFDRIALDDPAAGGIDRWADVLVTSWTLPLDGSDMDHEWTVI